MPYVTNSECRQRFLGANVIIHDSFICAGGVKKENRTDTCRGDSGGPIQTYGFINNKDRMVLYGVVAGLSFKLL